MSNEERRVTRNIRIAGAKILFPNFEGKADNYNKEGDRSFCVIIPPDKIEQVLEDGWNVKYLKPREDDPEQISIPYLSVKVRFNPYPPIAEKIQYGRRVKLDEDTIGQLDWLRFENVDLVISPYNYSAMRNRPAGVSAYLKAIYVTVEEDEFGRKYANIPYVDEEVSFE